MKINTISPDKHKFLQVLRSIAKIPEKLYLLGQLPEERIPTVAIVGTRKPTTYGKEVAHTLASELARHGVIIVSGLALGVDAIAHKAALEAGGKTIAILGNGLSHIYPASHRDLARQILLQKGALISEYEPETRARQYHFLARNRLISGISDAVIIVEAASRSGTLNTVSHALQQGKEVFAVPGNITSPLSAGCNNLIRQGAAPVTKAEDILEVIAPQSLNVQSHFATLGGTPAETKLLTLLQQGVRDGDELLERSSMQAAEFTHTLTMLELTGSIRPLGANQWALRN